MVEEVLPRGSQLAEPAVANVDHVLLVREWIDAVAPDALAHLHSVQRAPRHTFMLWCSLLNLASVCDPPASRCPPALPFPAPPPAPEQVFSAALPPFQPAPATRYMLSAEAAGLPVTVAINKADLVAPERLQEMVQQVGVISGGGGCVMW